MNREPRKWKYSDDERPPESSAFCADCFRVYGSFPDMILSHDLWERINPSMHKGGGILCPTCIACRLDYLELWYEFMPLRLPVAQQ